MILCLHISLRLLRDEAAPLRPKTHRNLLLVVVLLMATAAHGRDHCTITSLKDDFKRASVVFLGESRMSDGSKAHFKVAETFKGRVGDQVEVEVTQFQRFVPSQTYIVFAFRDPSGRLYLHDCSHTNPVTSAFVERQVRTVRSRQRWWRWPVSSFAFRPRQAAP